MNTATTTRELKLSDIKDGDVFSEQSHYVFNGQRNGGNLQFLHLESNKLVNLGQEYVVQLLRSADQFVGEVEVGKEDKLWTAKQIEEGERAGNWTKGDVRVGDIKQKGIRSIWHDIHSAQVFTVNFNKQDKDLSAKALKEAKDLQLDEAVKAILDAQKSKKGVAKVAQEAILKIQENPILPSIKGDQRTLRGYKTQFDSINGAYDVVDMDIKTGTNKRVVNVNQINWLCFDGVMYIVK